MLPAVNRLRRPAQFADALRYGRRTARRRMIVHLSDVPAVPVTDDAAGDAGGDVGAADPAAVVGPPRIGLVVSRKVGSAVQRNRVRRRLRHLLRDRLAVLLPGDVLIIKATRATVDATSAELGSDLDAALSTLGRPKAPAGERGSRTDSAWRVPGHWSRHPVQRA